MESFTAPFASKFFGEEIRQPEVSDWSYPIPDRPNPKDQLNLQHNRPSSNMEGRKLCQKKA
jgi:hypothetical protein